MSAHRPRWFSCVKQKPKRHAAELAFIVIIIIIIVIIIIVIIIVIIIIIIVTCFYSCAHVHARHVAATVAIIHYAYSHS